MPKYLVVRKWHHTSGALMAERNAVHPCETPEEVDEVLGSRHYGELAPNKFTVAEILDWPNQKEISRAGNQG